MKAATSERETVLVATGPESATRRRALDLGSLVRPVGRAIVHASFDAREAAAAEHGRRARAGAGAGAAARRAHDEAAAGARGAAAPACTPTANLSLGDSRSFFSSARSSIEPRL